MRLQIAVLTMASILAGCAKEPENEQQSLRRQGIDSQRVGSVAIAVFNGPFGVAQGEPLSALKASSESSPGIYKLTSVPQPYPGIETYIVQNTPEHGTCMVKAVSVDIPSDSFGGTLRTAVDKVRDDLNQRYGSPTNAFDFLTSGSIWNDPQDWMMGLSKKERTYAYYWQAPKAPDKAIWRDVQTVGLNSGSDGQAGWYTIEYDFNNTELCDQDLKIRASKSL